MVYRRRESWAQNNIMKEFRTHKWPLNVSNFTWIDRLKIANFFLNPSNKWTMGDNVKRFEREMAAFVGSRFALFVSSGSTANTILAMWLKDQKKKPYVVFPSTTWTTSVSPFIREGFIPKFIDINIEDLSMDINALEYFIKENRDKVAAVFITSLIGITPNISKLKDISRKYDVLIMMDNCENTFGQFNGSNVSSHFTSTTSTYFGHQIQSIEGGFIFTNSEKIYERILMYRNHGMVRSLENHHSNKIFYTNSKVDPQFDFYCLGNNFRNSEIHALIGLLDMKRIDYYIKSRMSLYDHFHRNIDPNKYIKFPSKLYKTDCMFCIPIISKSDNKGVDRVDKAKKYCKDNGIEYRPIISGNLLRQTCFRSYGNPKNFPVSEYIHEYGFYVGLHPQVKMDELYHLVNNINNL